MIDFDIERFVRKYMTKRPESLLKADFEKYADEMHKRIDGKRMLVVGGAGTIGSNYVKAALRNFKPAAMYVVDIDENQLTELTRELRSAVSSEVISDRCLVTGSNDQPPVTNHQPPTTSYHIPDEYVTEPIDLGSKLFDKFFRAHGPFDIVANFAARKHVRAERDVHSIEAMCETNVFMAKKLLDLLLENPPEAFFCVSTDKAANPVNVMGATKKLMEETIMAYAAAPSAQVRGERGEVSGEGGEVRGERKGLHVVTARFANVAFSNGSLPIGWLNRIAKKQPLSCPLGIRRFFVSPIESGELCLAASVLADSGDIVYPKLDSERDMIPFDVVVKDMLNDMGIGCKACSSTAEAKQEMANLVAGGRCLVTGANNQQPTTNHQSPTTNYPVEFFGSDTDGEKTFEEFYTDADVKDEEKFVNLGVVKNAKRRPVAEVEAIFARLHDVFDKQGATKEDVVEVLKEYLPNFNHISKGKSLDGRM